MRKSLFGIIAATFIFTSCSEDIDLTADYKDITVTYGLLDENKDTNWIRIQKAFLGDDNALLYAVIPDSLYYPTSLVAWVKSYNSLGAQVDSFGLERMVNVFVKDPGNFATDSNVLYRMVGTISSSKTYKLFIKKPNGDTTYSETTLCNDVTMGYPPTSSTPLDWEPDNILTPSQSVKFRWVKDDNSYAYQMGLKFNYQEWPVINPGNVTDTSFTYYFPMFKYTSDYACLSNQVCYEVTKEQFYGMIVNNIENNPDLARRFTGLDVIVLQATEELYNYITINAPSLSYVQKVTAYTNINNGQGIFASRTSAGTQNVPLSTQTSDSLRLGRYTYMLNFQP